MHKSCKKSTHLDGCLVKKFCVSSEIFFLDLANPKTNRNKTAGFTDQERADFTRLLDAGLCFQRFGHITEKELLCQLRLKSEWLLETVNIYDCGAYLRLRGCLPQTESRKRRSIHILVKYAQCQRKECWLEVITKLGDTLIYMPYENHLVLLCHAWLSVVQIQCSGDNMRNRCWEEFYSLSHKFSCSLRSMAYT